MKHTSTLAGRKTGSGASAPKSPPIANEADEVADAAPPQALSMYDALCRSAMNRDANRICAAAANLLALLDQFGEDYHEGTLEAELRQAGLLGKGEHPAGDTDRKAEHWLSDTQGLVWVLETFVGLFSSSLYPLDRETFRKKGIHAFELSKATPKPR